MGYRLLLLFLWSLGLSTLSFAQKKISIGVAAEPQLVFLLNQGIENKDDLAYKPLAGMSGGLSVSYDITSNIFVQLRTLYSQEGGRYEELPLGGDPILFTTRLETFQFPIYGGYRLYTKDSSRWVFMAGVQASYLSRANAYNNSTALISDVPASFYEFPNLYAIHEQWTISAVANVGVDVPILENAYLNLYLQGAYGLTDVEDKGVNYLVREGNTFVPRNYWEWKRSFDPNSASKQLALGFLIGIQYYL